MKFNAEISQLNAKPLNCENTCIPTTMFLVTKNQEPLLPPPDTPEPSSSLTPQPTTESRGCTETWTSDTICYEQAIFILILFLLLLFLSELGSNQPPNSHNHMI